MLRSEHFVKDAIGLRKSRYHGIKYRTTVQNITGLIRPGSDGINHGELACVSSA